MTLVRIVSGGQTGVDRAALDAALDSGPVLGGWCPRGRRAEDGVIPDRYPLHETPSRDYAQRPRWNVRDSDATAILVLGAVEGGTGLTVEVAIRTGKPLLIIQLEEYFGDEKLSEFVLERRTGTLNVAGPRESHCPGIYLRAFRIVHEAIARMRRVPLYAT